VTNVKKIRFSANFNDTGPTGTSYARYEAGKDYPADDAEAQRCIARGIAAEVDVPDEPEAEPVAADAVAEPVEAAPAKPSKKSKAE
jgi:hypothetical protein